MPTAELLASKIGVACDSCLEECLIRMEIDTGPSTNIPVYRVKEFYQKLEAQFWVHEEARARELGIQ